MNTHWRSPWPQWRTHWHVLHAWPAPAQALALIAFTLCLCLGLSMLYSGEAWQVRGRVAEEALAWQTKIDQLQAQLKVHQAQMAGLQSQTHPSGLDIPAWQMKVPQLEDPGLRQPWLSLATAHGLQAPPSVDENTAVWVGPLPHLLAAWQRLPQSLPHHAIDAFELRTVAGTKQLQLSVNWLAWPDLAAAFKQTQASKPGPRSSATSPVLTASKTMLHNPFALDGLRLALPEAAQRTASGDLHGVPLSELRWVGMLQQAGVAQALVAHAGQIRPVQIGQAMGQDFGQVVQIAPDHLLLREWHANALGHWQMQTNRFPSKGSP